MGVNSMIERAVRRQVFGQQCVQRLEVGKIRAAQILKQARALDDRLERAEVQRDVAEAERNKAVYELERLFHFIPALVVFKALDGRYLRVNEYAASGFACKPSDMVGHMPEEFFPAEQVVQCRVDDAEVIRTGKGMYGYLATLRWGGEDRVFRAWKIPIYNGASTPTGLMVYAVNLTHVGDLSIEVLGED